MTDLSISPLDDQFAVTATDRVFEVLYQAVISLDLPPGTKVSEIEVAKQLGVSRQPVRDAFFRLSKLGFLLIRPQRATTVTKISEQAVHQASFIRSALESSCLRVAIEKITGEQVAELEMLLDMQAAASKAGDGAKFHELDELFHRRICELAGHAYAWTLIREQKAHLDRVRYLTLPFNTDAALNEHREVLDAIRARNPAKAEEKLQAHLLRLRDLIEQVRAEHPQYFEAIET